MTFRGEYGTKVDEGVRFCPGCGGDMTTPAPEQQAQVPPQQASPAQEQPASVSGAFADKVKKFNNKTDEPAAHDAKDIADNKGMAILAYLGPLVFIPMFANKDSKFARSHVNQGLTLFIVYVAYTVVQIILTAILHAIFPFEWDWNNFSYDREFIYGALSTILSLVWVVIGILAVIGIINAVNSKAKELPIIGKIKLLK